MPAESTPEPPIVFISYSHDSDAHKEWVRELATALRSRYGIDVILDQWEIGPGDDVPKFMEASVKRAFRVIMVCTETYVRKADDGRGGVGYEAMIVTGELVADLGTRKFIPAMRQSGEKPQPPTCVSTRYYVDFADDTLFDERLEELAREIHNAPRFEKPRIGENPFINPATAAISGTQAILPDTPMVSEQEVYRDASMLAAQGDFAKWRELIHGVKKRSATELLKWRNENEHRCPATDQALPDYFFPGVATHASLFAAAFGAFDSTNQRFHNQLGIIDTIRYPEGWELGGSIPVVYLPDLILFTYQALMGGLAISRGNFEAAFKLASTSLEHRFRDGSAQPLFKSKSLMGWPEALNHSCTNAWAFLMRIATEWQWLHQIFGSDEDTKASIAAYYAFLNTMDGISTVKAKLTGSPKERPINVPLCFATIEKNCKQRAKALLFADPDYLLKMFNENMIVGNQIAENWPYWIAACGNWLSGAYKSYLFAVSGEVIFHYDLPRIVLPASNQMFIE